MEHSEIRDRLASMRQAYRQLYQGAEALLEMGSLYWTERLLLRLVHYLYERRLQQMGEILSDGD